MLPQRLILGFEKASAVARVGKVGGGTRSDSPGATATDAFLGAARVALVAHQPAVRIIFWRWPTLLTMRMGNHQASAPKVPRLRLAERNPSVLGALGGVAWSPCAVG